MKLIALLCTATCLLTVYIIKFRLCNANTITACIRKFMLRNAIYIPVIILTYNPYSIPRTSGPSYISLSVCTCAHNCLLLVENSVSPEDGETDLQWSHSGIPWAIFPLGAPTMVKLPAHQLFKDIFCFIYYVVSRLV